MLFFCLAHAGGSTIVYEKLKSYLSIDVQFVSLELPGHLKRANELLCTDSSLVIDDLLKTICNYIDQTKEDYVLFGHSLGAVLAYSLFFTLRERNKRLPIHMIFSGRWPPFVTRELDSNYVDIDAFIDDEISNDPKLLQYFREVIRSDFELLNDMPFKEVSLKIDVEISVLWGTEDKSMTYKDIKQWEKIAGNSIHFYPIQGDHFYPINKKEVTALCINQILLPYQNR
ncbi:thioesterase II family protein [Hungatella hathewayi]|uniref:thioesterase II family protein n=1 Tax=Hungatella hathewayi TaxID=154046 RepID=UPI0035639F22